MGGPRSITDAVAFLVGATIKFPAMQAFCINAGVGVAVNFFLQVNDVILCATCARAAKHNMVVAHGMGCMRGVRKRTRHHTQTAEGHGRGTACWPTR